MKTTHELLEHHILYGLDKAIVDHLTPILARELGEPFLDYLNKQRRQDELQAEGTRARGKEMVGRPVALQDDLLVHGFDPQVNWAWNALLTAAGPQWRDLCMLYDSVYCECRDLERMAIAQQTAEDSGDAAHARRVREIMDLPNLLSPAWCAAS